MDGKFLIETSARHVHLNLAALNLLFGVGYELTFRKDLSQPGQFVCNERVSIVGPKNEIKNVVILGPLRENVQVEVSATDGRNLGLNPPLRESGCLDGSCGCELVGPNGKLVLEEGLIVAKRHIHATRADAERLSVGHGDVVWVKVVSDGRSAIFGDVVVRVSDDFSLAMHVDTDESNAAGCFPGCFGEIFRFDGRI